MPAMSWLVTVLVVAASAAVELPVGLSLMPKDKLRNWHFDIVCTSEPCRVIPADASFLQVGNYIDTPNDLLDREFAGTVNVVRQATDGAKPPGQQKEHAFKEWTKVGSTKDTLALKRCFAMCPQVDRQSNEEPRNSLVRVDSLCKQLCITTTAQVSAHIGKGEGLPHGEKYERKPDGELASNTGGKSRKTYDGGVIDFPVFDAPCPKVDDRECNNHGVCEDGKCKCAINYTNTDACLPDQAPKVKVTGLAGDAHLTVKDKFTSGYTAEPNGFAYAYKVCNGKGKPRVGGYCECDDPMNNGFDEKTGKRNCQPVSLKGGSKTGATGVFDSMTSTVRGNTQLFGCFQPPGCVKLTDQFNCGKRCKFCKTKGKVPQSIECTTVQTTCEANPLRPETEPGNGFYQFMRRVFTGMYIDKTNINPFVSDEPKVTRGAMLLFSPDNIDGAGCEADPSESGIVEPMCTRVIRELRALAVRIQDIYGFPKPFNAEDMPEGHIYGSKQAAKSYGVDVTATRAQAATWTKDGSDWMNTMFSICEIIIDSPAPMPKTAGKYAGKPRGRATDPQLYDSLMKVLTYAGEIGQGPNDKIRPPGYSCNDRLKDELLNGRPGYDLPTIGPGFKMRLVPSDYTDWEKAHYKMQGKCLNGEKCAPGGPGKWEKPIPKRCQLGMLPSPMSDPPVCCNPNCDVCGTGQCSTAAGYDKDWAEANCCVEGIHAGGRICTDEKDTSCRMTTSPKGFVPTKTNCGKVPAGLDGQHTRRCCPEGFSFDAGKCKQGGKVCALWPASLSDETPSCLE